MRIAAKDTVIRYHNLRVNAKDLPPKGRQVLLIIDRPDLGKKHNWLTVGMWYDIHDKEKVTGRIWVDVLNRPLQNVIGWYDHPHGLPQIHAEDFR